MPTQMKCVLEDESLDATVLSEEITVDPIVRGFISDWDAMEDLLHHLVYSNLGWEIENEGHILFADPLLTPIKLHITIMVWNVRGVTHTCFGERFRTVVGLHSPDFVQMTEARATN